jgi:hypothetical protein
MIGPSELTSYYSLDDLQALVEYVQIKLFATKADLTAEASVWTPLQLEFIGKVATVKWIPAAIDYWMDQQEQVTLTGTNENESFAARLAHLREVQRELAEDIAAEAPWVLPGTLASTEPAVSYYDNGRGILNTPDPRRFKRQPGDHRYNASLASWVWLPWEP